MGKQRNPDNKAGSEFYLNGVTRMLRSYVKRVRCGELVDAEPLAHLARLQRELDEQTALVVLDLKARGLSWQEIGDGLGMTRGAAFNKYVGRMYSTEYTGTDAAQSVASP